MIVVFLKASLGCDQLEIDYERPHIHRIKHEAKLIVVPINVESQNFMNQYQFEEKIKTPKPTFTKYVYPKNLGNEGSAPQFFSKDIEIDFPQNQVKQQSDLSNIKNQLTSTPMIVFYSVLGCCVIFLCGAFLFFYRAEEYNEKTEEIAAAELKRQLIEALDADLTNEKSIII